MEESQEVTDESFAIGEVVVFYMSERDIRADNWHDGESYYKSGWYWMPEDGSFEDVSGPFESEELAWEEVEGAGYRRA